MVHPLVWIGAALVGVFVWQKRKSGAQSFPVTAQTPAMTRPLGSSGPGQTKNSGYNPSGFLDGLSEAPQATQPLNPNQNINAPNTIMGSPVPFEVMPGSEEVVFDPSNRFADARPVQSVTTAPEVAAAPPKVRGSIISTERTSALPV